jgi:dihydrofolate reductase
MDDFAVAIDNTPKIVFSRTLKHVDWKSAKLASQDPGKEVLELKQSRSGGRKDILVGSRSLIIQLLNSNLIDQFQICIHPVLEGKGLPLFDQIKNRIVFKLVKTKSLKSGATVFYYEPTSEKTTNR